MKRLVKAVSLLFVAILAMPMMPLHVQDVRADGIDLSAENFPDAAFRDYLDMFFNLDFDSKLNYEEIEKITDIDASGEGISNFAGIEFLYNLKNFDCSDNDLSEHGLDLSQNTALEFVNCMNCKLESLKLPHTDTLDRIFCSVNNLTELDVSNCTNLDNLQCGCNQISQLNITGCSNLHLLYCYDNNLSGLDLSEYNDLDQLLCYGNENMSSLDLSHNPVLTYLECHYTNITQLCIAYNPFLKKAFNTGNDSDTEQFDRYAIEGENLLLLVNPGTVITTVTPTPTATNTPTATPTSKPASTTTNKPSATPTSKPAVTSAPAPETGVAAFIERLYTVALDRPSDPYGKADWLNRVRTQGYTGADLARGFLFSPEFIDKNMSDSEFMDVLYKTFFNREPDAEKANWLNLMSSGWSKKQVIDGFINSTEWANLCLIYGIASGSTFAPNITVAPSQDVINFATRLYTTCLGREADPNGLNDWADQIANMKITGSEAAHGFFFSAEFIDANYSDAEYVTRLYRTFMDREPDPAGFADWKGQLAAGASRESVFRGFAGSAEWAGICADYGILK